MRGEGRVLMHQFSIRCIERKLDVSVQLFCVN